MTAPFRALRVEDAEGVPWVNGMTWHPVRMELGLHAFGAGAFTAANAGDLVVEPHTEAHGRGHEELYVVLAGRATFTLDGEELDAPAGTLVFVGDPELHRAAVAVDDDTTVLALGGPPSFEPAGHEWLARARPLVRTEPERARAILEAGRRELPQSPGIGFGFALLLAAAGDRDGARAELRAALEREPALAGEAAREPDLAEL